MPSPPFDLSTLLALRIGIDALVALAFWGLMQRYPRIGGPGWWSAAGVVSILGSISLWLEGQLPAWWTIGVAYTAFMAAGLFAWLGLRSYLGMSRPLPSVVVFLVGFMVFQTLFLLHWDMPKVRQGAFLLLAIAFIVLALRDIVRADPLRQVPELQALKWLSVGELVVLGFFLVTVPWMGVSMDVALPIGLFCFLLSRLLRVVLYGALVAYRMRQDGDRARKSLQVREHELSTLIENLSAGVIVLRPDRTVVTINTAARDFLGWSPATALEAQTVPLGRVWRLLGEDGQPLPRHEVPFERVMATGQPVKNLVLGVQTAADGDLRWGLCTAFPENDSLGGLRHLVFTFADITSLRDMQTHQQQLEQQLSQSQKMEALGTLAGGVAHDFNNILAAILGNADLARQDLEPGSRARESLHEISTAARRGRELVRQILAFSRQQPLTRTAIDLNDVVDETCRLLRTAVTPQVELVVGQAAASAMVRADATQIGQVLLNLGTNAIAALGGRAGRIVFEVDNLLGSDPRLPRAIAQACLAGGVGAVRVTVRDNGCGMSEATMQRIYEPFFTTKEVGQGTGLGLPVALGIVQAHEGAIEVRSREGEGTSFDLYFPALAPTSPGQRDTVTTSSAPLGGTMVGEPLPGPAALCSPGTPSPATAHEETSAMADDPSKPPRHILYLDDDDTLVFLVRRLLERRGHKVTAFSDQREAIEAVRQQPHGFNLLLTDYNMPGMSGLDVAREVLTLNPALPVAVASGYITDELQAEARAVGVREVVFKTDAVESFCEVVARLAS